MAERYFVGIELPEPLTERLMRIQDELILEDEMIRPLKPHITLLHPDSLKTVMSSVFLKKISKLAKKRLPLTVSLQNVSVFNQQVLYISVQSQALMQLQQEMVDLLPARIKATYYVSQVFVPHVTIAQARSGHTLPTGLDKQYTYAINHLIPVAFDVDHLMHYWRKGPRQYENKRIEP